MSNESKQARVLPGLSLLSSRCPWVRHLTSAAPPEPLSGQPLKTAAVLNRSQAWMCATVPWMLSRAKLEKSERAQLTFQRQIKVKKINPKRCVLKTCHFQRCELRVKGLTLQNQSECWDVSKIRTKVSSDGLKAAEEKQSHFCLLLII